MDEQEQEIAQEAEYQALWQRYTEEEITRVLRGPFHEIGCGAKRVENDESETQAISSQAGGTLERSRNANHL